MVTSLGEFLGWENPVMISIILELKERDFMDMLTSHTGLLLCIPLWDSHSSPGAWSQELELTDWAVKQKQNVGSNSARLQWEFWWLFL